MQRRSVVSAVDKLAQVDVVLQAFGELVGRFNGMKYDDVDLDSGVRTEAPIEDPEFGYQMLGVLNALIGTLQAIIGQGGMLRPQ